MYVGNGDTTNEKIDGLRKSVCLYILNIPIISTPFHPIPLKSPCSVCVGGTEQKQICCHWLVSKHSILN